MTCVPMAFYRCIIPSGKSLNVHYTYLNIIIFQFELVINQFIIFCVQYHLNVFFIIFIKRVLKIQTINKLNSYCNEF